MNAAPAVRRWGYVACCCAALALSACPQLLGDDFVVNRNLERPDSGAGAGTSGRDGLGGTAGWAGANGSAGSAALDPPDGGAGGTSGTGGGGANPPSCSDGVRNQDETGVDCGGVCSACCEYGPFHDVLQVNGLGTDDRFGPNLSSDGASLYFSVLTDDNSEDLFRATRTGTSIDFSDMVPIANLNGSTREGSPFVSSDDRTLFFFSDRMGGVGNRDLWVATRPSSSDEFAAPELVPGVNSTEMELLPRLSPDGLTLLFESTRGSSSDIWAAERLTPTGAFGTPYLRTDLSTSSREEGVSLTRDQRTIVLASSRGGDMGLWLATRPSAGAEFGPATLLSELDSDEDEIDPALSADGSEIFFVTTRDGDYRIYHAVRDCR